MNSVEMTGKTVDEAIQLALAELKVTRNEVTVKIIDEGRKGIFGFGSKPAVVSVTKLFDPERKAKEFIEELAASIGVSFEISTVLSDKKLDINLSGDSASIFIGKRGQTLEALQYIINLVINKGEAPYIGVVVDIENYRQRRRDTLESLAYNLAKKVKLTHKSVSLEPMIAYERRIIHSALQNDRLISTKSEGEEPYRNVVILPKKPSAYPRSNNINTLKNGQSE